MKIYHIRQTQFLPLNPEDAWRFFSEPTNLGKITPPEMAFRIVSNSHPGGMLEGQLIRYTIRILPAIRVNWLTEIQQVKFRHSFTDVQLKGPYSLWKHTHVFKEVPGGVEMTDEVDYAIPFGFPGRIVHRILIRPRLEAIFAYRRQILERKFKTHTIPETLSM